MTKQLTDSEREALTKAKIAYHKKDELFPSVGFDAGFIAGLSYNQAKLDKLAQAGIEFNIQTTDKLDKLIRYIKGEITRSEVEELLK